MLECAAESFLPRLGLIEVWRILQEKVLDWKVLQLLGYQDCWHTVRAMTYAHENVH